MIVASHARFIKNLNFNTFFHLALPGILLGDLGNKVGDAANDTGFMVLNNVRIPRRYMLMRHIQVTPEGQFVRKQINKQAHYQTMVKMRN